MMQAKLVDGVIDGRIKNLMQVCLQYKGHGDKYHVAPIPDGKLASARKSLGVPSGERIVALLDLSAFGAAEEAMLIAETGVYWKSLGEKRASKLSWPQLRGRSITKKDGFAFQDIDFGNGLKMDLQGAGELGLNRSDVILSLLHELSQVDQATQLGAESSAGREAEMQVAGGFIGLAECEFCGGKIKPDVTYCKHCGIKLRG